MSQKQSGKCLTLRPLAAAIQRVAVYETKLASFLFYITYLASVFAAEA